MRPSHHRGPVFFGLSLTLALLLSLGGTTLGLLSAGAAPLAAPITPPTISGFIGATNGLQVDDLDNNPQTAPNANVTTGGVTDLDCVNPSPAGEVDSNCPQVAGATAYLDWNTLPGAGTAGKYVINDKVPDDSFAGTGTTSCLQPDHSAPAKEDIQRLYLANNNEFLYFGLVDASPNGDSRHLVIFHKNPIDSGETCAGNGSILRLDLTPQDRMILALFHPSASEPAARIFQVVGNPANQLVDLASDFTNAAVWAPSATATNFAVNTTAIPNDVLGGGVSDVADTFGEGAVPMSALGISACSGGKFFVTVITRSSGSGGGTAKDFIAGAYQFNSITVTASLTPSCNAEFGYAAQAFGTDNNPVPDANAAYDWTCTGGVDPQGKSGTQAAAAGGYSCTVTASLVDNPTCQATSASQTVTVYNPLAVTVDAAPSCNLSGNGYAATVTGGSGSVGHAWSGTGVTFSNASAASGTYSVGGAGTYVLSDQVTDLRTDLPAGSCTASDSDQVALSVFGASASLTSTCDLTLPFTASTSGGIGTVTQQWSFGGPTAVTPSSTTALSGTAGVAAPGGTGYTGTFTATDTRTDIGSPSIGTYQCTAGASPTASVFGPITVSIAPDATGLACPLVDTAGTDVTYSATISGGQAPYTVTWLVGGENTAPVCGNSASCLVDSAATNFCALITVQAKVDDSFGLCPEVSSETESVTKQTTVTATNN